MGSGRGGPLDLFVHTVLNLPDSHKWLQTQGHIQRALFNLSGAQNRANRYEYERFVRRGDYKGCRETGSGSSQHVLQTGA